MNSREHVGIGIIAFFAYAWFAGNIVSTINHQWILEAVAVFVGSLVPDILEPPTSYRHRRLFHSVRVLFVVIILFAASALVAFGVAFFSDFSAFYIVSCFFLGYMFHLLADSVTPMGLPS